MKSDFFQADTRIFRFFNFRNTVKMISNSCYCYFLPFHASYMIIFSGKSGKIPISSFRGNFAAILAES